MAKKNDSRNMPSGSIEPNRANDTNRREDVVGSVHVGLYDIDNAIKYYFDNVILPMVTINDEPIKIPVIYGSPERWKSAQKDGYIKDQHGKVQAPVIMYRRTNMEKRRDLSRNVDANNPQIFHVVRKRFSSRNAYDRFSVLTNAKPQEEEYRIITPDYVTITYECSIWCDYVEHMNKITEAINYAEGAYWGDEKTAKFSATINSFNQSTTVESGQDRLIKTDFQISIFGTIVSDAIQKRLKQSSEKEFTKSRLKVDFNVVDSISQTTSINKDISGSDILSKACITTGLDMATVLYLNKIKDAVATSALTTTTTATFENISIAEPPAVSGLPPTEISQFHFFINGQYVEPTALVSFTQSGANCILTINSSILTFELNSSMVISVFGKFE